MIGDFISGQKSVNQVKVGCPLITLFYFSRTVIICRCAALKFLFRTEKRAKEKQKEHPHSQALRGTDASYQSSQIKHNEENELQQKKDTRCRPVPSPTRFSYHPISHSNLQFPISETLHRDAVSLVAETVIQETQKRKRKREGITNKLQRNACRL